MSDDEDDYMSDKFLAGASSAIRPSLVFNRANKRQIQVDCKRKDHIKKQKEYKASNSAAVNNEKLQVALSKPLEAANKGFQLLAKMGYKPGQTLGKVNSDDKAATTSRQQRLLEPIGITLKTDRQGLGRETALRDLKERRQQIREQRLLKHVGGENNIEEFRRRTTQKHEERFTLNALRRCQVTCENLDLQSQIQEPEMPWFWPERPKESEEESNEEHSEESEGEEEEEFTNQEKLEMLTNYVRTSYYFCYWCGVRYNDERDLTENCPGLTNDEH